MESHRFSCSLPNNILQKIDKAAEEKGKSRKDVIADACRMYLDFESANAPGSYLPQWAIQQINGICGNLSTQLNNRSNQLLSAIAIELTILQMIVADGLEVDENAVQDYKLQAVEALKTNQRVFRMEEVIK